MNDEAEQLRAELERVQKQAAAMRQALERLSGFGPRDIDEISLHGWVNTVASDVLNEDDAGSDFIRRSEVQFMFDALMAVSTDAHNPAWWKTAQDALQRAFALGFRESKPVPPV